MYTIRVDQARGLLLIMLSGRVDTDEALRVLSQALTLAETDAINAVACDITAVRRGPGSLLLVAAGLALGYRPGMRIALLSGSEQQRAASRFMRYSGLRDGVQVFTASAAADAWLGPAMLPAAPAMGSPLGTGAGQAIAQAAPPSAKGQMRPGRRAKGSRAAAAGSAA